MTLDDFIAEVREGGADQHDIAKRLRISQPSVSKLLRRKRASARVALEIEAWSGRRVPAESLSDEVALVRRNMRAA